MSAQRLGAKRLRRISEAAGAPVRIGWAHGGYVFGFATEDHRHGAYSLKTGEVEWADPDDDDWHYSSCYGDEWPEHLRAVRRPVTRDRRVTVDVGEPVVPTGPTWWHAFGQVRDDLGGCWQLTVYGGGTKAPTAGEIANVARRAGAHLATWDHEPTDLEKEEVTPPEYRDEFGPLAHTIPTEEQP